MSAGFGRSSDGGEILLAAYDTVPAPKGASAHILRNHRILADSGRRVALLTLGDTPLPGLRHIAVRPAGSTWLERAVDFHARAAEVLRRHTFRAVHVRSPFEGLPVPAETPIVYEVNALYSVEIPVHYPDLLSHPGFRERMRAAELLLLDRAAAVITPSPVTALYLGDLGVPDVRIVPNAPSIPNVVRPPRADGPVRLAYIGTLAPWQGLHQALRCLARLTHLDWELHVRSASAKGRWVEKMASKLGISDRVHLADALPPDELAGFLASCEIGLAPLTPSERNVVQGCMPVKILDYMRAGLAVLAPDLPVCTELLGDAPAYRAWSRQSLTSMLEHLLTTEREPLGRNNQLRVERLFSEEIQRDALLAVYEGLP